jgi:hypothetical protein
MGYYERFPDITLGAKVMGGHPLLVMELERSIREAVAPGVGRDEPAASISGKAGRSA